MEAQSLLSSRRSETSHPGGDRVEEFLAFTSLGLRCQPCLPAVSITPACSSVAPSSPGAVAPGRARPHTALTPYLLFLSTSPLNSSQGYCGGGA